MLEIPRNEVLRYLGYHGMKPSQEILERLQECIEDVQKAATPRTTHRIFPLASHGDDTLEFAGIAVNSRDLARNLQGCQDVCMFAATIGTEVDRLIRKAEVLRMSDAVIYQAAGAAMVEELCDQFNRDFQEEAAKKGLACRPRFSPGYGDFSLEHQRDFVRILNTPKILGISLLDSLLMAPSKSVTAVIGRFDPQKSCNPETAQNHCQGCRQPGCQFRAT